MQVIYMNSIETEVYHHKEKYIEERRINHISMWLINELGYDEEQVNLFWSNINGLVDIDLQDSIYNTDTITGHYHPEVD